MKKLLCLILAVMFFLLFVIQAAVAFAAAPPTQNSSLFAGPYTSPPEPMDEYSFSDASIYEAIRLDLVTKGISGVSLRSDSISTLKTNKVQSLEIAELDVAITANDILSIIKYFPNLKILKLENCYITTIPMEIEKLTYLEELYLGNNNITSISNVDLTNLMYLRVLDLSNNKLSDISTLFKHRSLNSLNLSNNSVKSEMIPADIDLPVLTDLDLSYNELTSEPTSLASITSLKNLYLNNNSLVADPTSIFSKTTTLNVSNNEFAFEGDWMGTSTFPRNHFFSGIFELLMRYYSTVK